MTEDGADSLPIGQVAEQAGLPASTLRFYERAGLLPAPARVAGRRRYHPRVYRRLAVIDVAQRSGFSLAEIRQLLTALDSGESTSERWNEMAESKLPEVEALIERAHAMKRLLVGGHASARLAGVDCGYPSPFAYVRGPGLVHASFLFDTLLWKDRHGTLIPWLARRWERSPDACEWVFELRSDVRWHDGEPLTAEDVVFSFGYLTKGPGRDSGVIHLQGLENVKEVIAEQPDTVRFRLHQPYAPFGGWIAGRMLIIPAHIWSAVRDPVGFRGPGAVTGSGPYKLESHTEGTGSYSYVANNDFFLDSPYVQRLDFAPIADPVEAFRDGLIDAIHIGVDEDVPAELLASFEVPTYRMISRAGELHLALHVNLRRGFPFNEKRFRQAIAYGIDRAELVRTVLGGRGEPGSMGGMAPSHALTPGDLPTYDHDPVRADSLLDELGLGRVNRRAIRRLAGGAAFLPSLVVSSACPAAAVQLVQDHLRRIGVKVRTRKLDPQGADAASAAGDYDLALVHSGSLGGDPDWLRIRLSADARTDSHARIHGYHNSTFEILAAWQAATTDPAERAVLVEEMQRIVAEDVPFLPLYVPTRVTIFPVRSIFDAWYFTEGGVWGGYPGPLDKHAFVRGERYGGAAS